MKKLVLIFALLFSAISAFSNTYKSSESSSSSSNDDQRMESDENINDDTVEEEVEVKEDAKYKDASGKKVDDQYDVQEDIESDDWD